jgi:anti-anti-sigma factor
MKTTWHERLEDVSLSIIESNVDEITILGLSGDVDISTLPRLADALGRFTHDAHTLAIDLDGITVLDDAALGIILGAAARLDAHGGRLCLIVTNTKIRDHLHTTRLDQIVSLHSSIGDVQAHSRHQRGHES